MASSSEPPRISFSQRFWALWAKIWWLVALLLAAGVIALANINKVLLVRIISGFFLLGGAGTLLYGIRALSLAKRSEQWPTVEGTILSSEIEQESHTSDVGGHVDTYTEYFPAVEYEYRYGEEAYRSRRILFANVNYKHSEAQAIVAQYPVGSRTRVYFDPENPKLSVLQKGVARYGGKYAIPFVVGGGFLLLSLGAWFLARSLE